MRLTVTISNEDGEVLECETFLPRDNETGNRAAAEMIDKLGFTWEQVEKE